MYTYGDRAFSVVGYVYIVAYRRISKGILKAEDSVIIIVCRGTAYRILQVSDARTEASRSTLKASQPCTIFCFTFLTLCLNNSTVTSLLVSCTYTILKLLLIMHDQD